ncbi:MAG: hypothetical protein H6598_08900 [Flavobacteriales bacterium]|nr:hypothetical protein [Flavobacteriales bacterium]MCB9196328.1 hypothetical protein [Flavobacteriales bacterium]
METIFLFVFLYGILWFATMFMLISKDKIMNRIFQIGHSFYFVLFCLIFYLHGTFYIPFHLLAGLQMVSSLFFAYRYVISRRADPEDNVKIPLEEQLVPEVRKNITQFKKTINSVFNNHSQQNNQEL